MIIYTKHYKTILVVNHGFSYKTTMDLDGFGPFWLNMVVSLLARVAQKMQRSPFQEKGAQYPWILCGFYNVLL
jgi:hypothetical protein